MERHFPRSIMAVAVLMILFGLGEVVTGLTHSFFGIVTSQGSTSAAVGTASEG